MPAMSTQNALWAPDDDEPLDVVLPQQRAQTRVAECAAVLLLDDGFSVPWPQLGDDLPRLAAAGKVVVGVLHPHDETTRVTRRLDQRADRRDQLVASEHPVDDPILYIDNQQGRRHARSLPPGPVRRQIRDLAVQGRCEKLRTCWAGPSAAIET